MKVVINECYGGFCLSQTALKLLKQYKEEESNGEKWDYNVNRNDPVLIRVVEELGKKEASNDVMSSLKIIEIPDDIEWIIEDYDGLERVVEKYRYWQ